MTLRIPRPGWEHVRNLLRKSWPPQISQRSSGGSEKVWTVSNRFWHDVHTYSYVGTEGLLREVRRQQQRQYDRVPAPAAPKVGAGGGASRDRPSCNRAPYWGRIGKVRGATLRRI